MKKSFVNVTPNKGRNNRTLSVKADANEDYVSRHTTFKVEGGGITKSVSIEQDPNPYVYIDCGYIFSSANIQEPYESSSDGVVTYLMFNVKFANFILSSKNRFIIKNISNLQVDLINSVISYIDINPDSQSLGTISIPLNEFTTEFIHNPENPCMTLSIIDITPAKLNEIVAKINAARDISTTGVATIRMFIQKSSTQTNLYIEITVN